MYELPGAVGSWVDPVVGFIVARRRSGRSLIAHETADCANSGGYGTDVLAVPCHSLALLELIAVDMLIGFWCHNGLSRGLVLRTRRIDIDFSRCGRTLSSGIWRSSCTVDADFFRVLSFGHS